jgi:hypothetical protein
MVETITFDFVSECWKKKVYPDGFDDLLENYIILKNRIYANITIHDITKWLSHLLCAIEVGIERDRTRFEPYKIMWREMLQRDWICDIECKWTVFK